MKVRLTWAVSFVIALAVCPLAAQTPTLSGIEAPYPALQSSVHIAGGIYGPGAVPYGPVGTPLVLSGANFGPGGPGSTVLFPGAQKGTTIAVTPTSWSGSILLVSVPSSATSGLVQVSAEGKISNGLPLVITPGVYVGSCPKSPPGSELAVTTSSLPNGTVGTAYNATLSAEGGSPPYAWSMTGAPTWLSLAPSTGVLTGTPTATGGPYNIVVEVTDSKSQRDEAELSVSVETQVLVQGTVYSYAAAYDPVGNVAGYNDSVMGMWSFGYGALNRLMSATPGTGAPGGYAGMNLCMNYDAYGNRTQSNWQAAACSPTSDPTTASYNSANHVTWTTVNSAVNGFTYDAAGDVTNDGANQYLYDGEGRVCAVETSSISGETALYGYIYDAEGRRVAKGTLSTFSCNLASNGFTLTESYVLGPGGEQLTVLDGSQKWERTNVYGGGKLLATYDAQGLHFHLTDPLGTRRVQTSAVGQPEEDCQGLPFGDGQYCYVPSNAPASADDSTPLHFTGKERDTESGNDYFGARYYASTMGRFMSPDPLPWIAWQNGNGDDQQRFVAFISNPQNFNMYAYVLNNPLNRTDPTGLYVCNGSSSGKDPSNCTDILIRYNLLKKADQNLKPGSQERKNLDRVLKALGKPGEKNGVTIIVSHSNSWNNKTSGNRSSQTITLSFQGMANRLGKLPGTNMADEEAAALAHEGSHVEDFKAGAPMNTMIENVLTERRAYSAQGYTYEGLNYGTSPYQIWSPTTGLNAQSIWYQSLISAEEDK